MLKPFVVVGTSVLFTLSAQAFVTATHKHLTQDALRPLGFDESSVDVVIKGNKYVDDKLMDWAPGHFDSESFEAGSAALRDRLDRIALHLVRCERRDALMELGMALHAAQDFYSHSTWVEMHRKYPNLPAPDLLALANPPASLVCDSAHFAEGLTSGYYPDRSTPRGKCSHGRLNKDNPFRNTAFGTPWYDLARAAAAAATSDFVQRTFESLSTKYPSEQTRRMIQFLESESAPCN